MPDFPNLLFRRRHKILPFPPHFRRGPAHQCIMTIKVLTNETPNLLLFQISGSVRRLASKDVAMHPELVKEEDVLRLRPVRFPPLYPLVSG